MVGDLASYMNRRYVAECVFLAADAEQRTVDGEANSGDNAIDGFAISAVLAKRTDG